MTPSQLPPEMVEYIGRCASRAEESGMLTPELITIIQQEKWFQLFVPKENGGLSLSLPEAVRLEENISFADASTGWVVTLCAGAGLFMGFFEEHLVKEIFPLPGLCIAGSGRASGEAIPVENGYLVTGSWSYASGAAHATHFTANCKIAGTSEIKSFLFKRAEVNLHSDWNYLGLRATSGYSFSVTALTVPVNRSFVIDAGHAQLTGAIYTYPFLQFAEATLAATVSGMCMHFLGLAESLLSTKRTDDPMSATVRDKGLQYVRDAMGKTELLREKFYSALDDSWHAHLSENGASDLQLRHVSKYSRKLAVQARNLVNQLYAFCGMEAARTGTLINQVWRDINTASQHVLLSV